MSIILIIINMRMNLITYRPIMKKSKNSWLPYPDVGKDEAGIDNGHCRVVVGPQIV